MNSNEGIVNLETDYLVIGAGAAGMVSLLLLAVVLASDLALLLAGFRRRGSVSLQDIHLRDLRPAREARRALEPRLPLRHAAPGVVLLRREQRGFGTGSEGDRSVLQARDAGVLRQGESPPPRCRSRV